LFLDTEAPGVQERLQLALEIEISRRQKQQDVVGEENGRHQRLPVIFQVARQHQEKRDRRAQQHHDVQRRQNAPHASVIEAKQ
jgi:hypothetical protein